MKTYTVRVHTEDEQAPDANGMPTVRQHAQTFEVTGTDADDIREKVRKAAAERNLPPIRSINFREDGIVIFCGEHPDRVAPNLVEGTQPVWKRPPGAPKL